MGVEEDIVVAEMVGVEEDRVLGVEEDIWWWGWGRI